MTNSGMTVPLTRTTRWLERIIEGAWLAALGLLPLFFMSFLLRPFYLPKAMLLQVIALVLLGALVARQLSQPQGPMWFHIRNLLRNPMIVAIAVFGVIVVLSTVFSISPWTSILGSVERRQGAFTSLSWIVVCIVLATQLRTGAQLRRLIITVLIASGIVCLIGIIQYHVPTVSTRLLGSMYTTRVASTTGNALSLSAYVAMTMPFTVAFGVMVFRQQSEFQNPGLILSSLAGLLLLQLWCLALSSYSYVLLLYLVPLGVLLTLLGLLIIRSRVLTLAMLGVLLAVITTGSALVLPQWQNAARGTPPPEALVSTEFATAERLHSTLYGRARYWVYALDVLPSARTDPQPGDGVPALRPFIGYGLETYAIVTQRHLPPERRTGATAGATIRDNPHNHYIYLAITTGILGLLAWLAMLATSAFSIYRLCRRAGYFSPYSVLGLAAGSALAGFMAHAIFNPVAINEEALLWMCFALIPAVRRLHHTASLSGRRGAPRTNHFLHSDAPTGASRTILAWLVVITALTAGVAAAHGPLLAERAMLQGLQMSATDDSGALSAYARAAELQPRESVYWGALGGLAYRSAESDSQEVKLQRIEQSLLALKKARDNQPLLAFWHSRLGDAQLYSYSSMNLLPWDESHESYERALELSPTNAVLTSKLAVAHMVAHDLDAATMALDEAEGYDPHWTRLAHLRIALMALEGDGDAAAQVLLSRLHDNPREIDTFIDVAATQLRSFGLLDEVASGMQRSIEVQGRQPIPLAIRGAIAALQDDNDQSADLLMRAVHVAESEEEVQIIARTVGSLLPFAPDLEDAMVKRLEQERSQDGTVFW